MKILYLNLKRKWFDMILSGEKKEEYRELKKHWINQLIWHDFRFLAVDELKNEFESGIPILKDSFYDVICFRNGYSKNAPEILIECKGIDIGLAVPEWSDNWQGEVFRIHLGEILNKKL